MSLKNKNQMDLMNDLKLPSATISSWVNAKKYPRIDKMQMLADYFGILKSDLMEEKQPNNTNTLPVYPIQILGKVSAGIPIECQTDIIGQTYITHKDYQNYFALQVDGDSMNNIIRDKSTVIVRKQDNLENGEIGVIMINGYDATVKRFKQDGNTVILIPDSNNKEHMPQIYNINDIEIKILGKVVEVVTKL
jgi:repressor LexA